VVTIFEARIGETITATLTPDLSEGGQPILPGTIVRSYILHRNPDAVGPGTLGGSVKFGGRILGLYTTDAGIDATDATLGSAQAQYATEAARGLEAEDEFVPTWSGRTVSFPFGGTSNADQVRVVTEVAP